MPPSTLSRESYRVCSFSCLIVVVVSDGAVEDLVADEAPRGVRGRGGLGLCIKVTCSSLYVNNFTFAICSSFSLGSRIVSHMSGVRAVRYLAEFFVCVFF